MFWKRKTILLALCLLITALLVACGESGGHNNITSNTSPQSSQVVAGQATSNLRPAVTTISSVATTSGSSTNPTALNQTQRALPDLTNRTFKYANLEFKVTQGLISNQLNPSSSSYSSDQAQLKLSLSISNPTKEVIRIDGGLFQLKLEDGTIFKEPVNLSIVARDSKVFELAFNVPITTKWDGAQLQFDQEEKEPVIIALNGPPSKSPYPISLAVGTEVTLKDPKVTYKLTKAMLDLDAQGTRVNKGKRFILMTILATNKDTKYEAYVSEDSFRLTIDNGQPQAPEKTDPVAQGVKELSNQEFSLVFSIPQNAKKLSLEVGEVDKDTTSIPLDLSTVEATATPPSSPNSTSLSVATPTVNQTTTSSSTGRTTTPSVAGSATSATTPTKIALTGSDATPSSDPCVLFTKEDFVAVFGKPSTEPSQENFPEWVSCDYQFADSANTSNNVYGLDFRVLKGNITRSKFENTYQVLKPRLQTVLGIGDLAFLLPSVAPDNPCSLFVLKGRISFTLSLLEPSSVPEAQKEAELKAAAQKILARL